MMLHSFYGLVWWQKGCGIDGIAGHFSLRLLGIFQRAQSDRILWLFRFIKSLKSQKFIFGKKSSGKGHSIQTQKSLDSNEKCVEIIMKFTLNSFYQLNRWSTHKPQTMPLIFVQKSHLVSISARTWHHKWRASHF